MDGMANSGAGNSCKTCKSCGCPHHKALPALVIVFGLLFLLGNMNVVTAGFVQTGWPVLVILGGLVKLTKKMCKCC